MRFHSPEALWLLLLVIPSVLFALRRRGSITLSTASRAGSLPRSFRATLAPLAAAIPVLAMTLGVVALARPQEPLGNQKRSTEGVAIQVVLDRSSSMNEPIGHKGRNLPRIDVVKELLREFISGDEGDLRGRPDDLIGLVAFARYADTVCPLVHAHETLIELMEQTQTVTNRSEDGTAIGDAVALGVSRLVNAEKELTRIRSQSAEDADSFTIKSKVLILLTDGSNNAGDISVPEAMKIAASRGVKVYVVGIGAGQRYAVIRTPMGDQRIPVGNAMDERELEDLAKETGGIYWPAEDAEAIRSVYAAIDRLEKTRVETLSTTRYIERYAPFAAASFALLAGHALLTATLLRRTSP